MANNKTTKTDIYKIDPRNIVVTKGFNSRCNFGDLDELKGSDMDPKALIERCPNVPDIYMACGEDDFLFEKNSDFHEFLKDMDIDVDFVKASGEHTWEFSEKYIKEFIKTLG